VNGLATAVSEDGRSRVSRFVRASPGLRAGANRAYPLPAFAHRGFGSGRTLRMVSEPKRRRNGDGRKYERNVRKSIAEAVRNPGRALKKRPPGGRLERGGLSRRPCRRLAVLREFLNVNYRTRI